MISLHFYLIKILLDNYAFLGDLQKCFYIVEAL